MADFYFYSLQREYQPSFNKWLNKEEEFGQTQFDFHNYYI